MSKMSHLSYQYIYFLCVIIWNSKYKHKCILKWNIWNVVFIYSSILLYLSSENICPCASFHIIFIDEINRKWKNFHYHWHVTSTVSFSHIKADTWMRVDFRRTNQDMNKQITMNDREVFWLEHCNFGWALLPDAGLSLSIKTTISW